MTPQEFDTEFDRIHRSAFRYEGLPVYAVDEEDEDLVAWRRGEAMAERSVRTSPWLARMARQTIVDGVEWCRVRKVPHPLSWYLRWEISGYIESQACGEQILLTDEGAPHDFWLFDVDTPDARVIVQHYNDHGVLQRYEKILDPVQVAAYASMVAVLRESAVPLNDWLAEHVGDLQGARAAG